MEWKIMAKVLEDFPDEECLIMILIRNTVNCNMNNQTFLTKVIKKLESLFQLMIKDMTISTIILSNLIFQTSLYQ